MATPLQQDGTSNRIVLEDGSVVYEAPSGKQYSRTGVDSLAELAARLCRIVNGSAVIIRRVFGENELLMLVLELTEVMCAVLQETYGAIAQGATASAIDTTKQDVIADLRSVLDKYDTGSV